VLTITLVGGAIILDPTPAAAAGFGHQESPEIPPPASAVLAEPNVSGLDPLYDQYLTWKEAFQNQYHLEYSLQSSLLPQWAAPKGGEPAIDFVWTPTLIWKPFADTAFGSGAFTFSAQQNQFWSVSNTTAMQNRLGLLTPPSDWFVDTIDYAQLTYTQTLPGNWRWLSATVGQYGFSLYDASQYAGNAQTNFVNYALAQNATQAYGSADLGGFLEAAMPARDLIFAGGFQGATNFSGSTITAHGLTSGKIAYFLAARWTPSFLAGGSYGLLWYAEPPLPEDELPAAHGFSFSAVQNLNAQWGLFLRANMATGLSTSIANSVASGVVRNNPFGHDPLDQLGFGIARNETNIAAVAAPARNAEWLGEVYYGYTVFKGLQFAPDIQLYPAPSLAPASGPVAIFTLRATVTF
jgi:Carbohydrate-selective porin, OprB family